MYLALKAFGGPELHLHGFHNQLENAYWIVGIGKLCLKAEQFLGDYQVGMAVSYFVCSSSA